MRVTKQLLVPNTYTYILSHCYERQLNPSWNSSQLPSLALEQEEDLGGVIPCCIAFRVARGLPGCTFIYSFTCHPKPVDCLRAQISDERFNYSQWTLKLLSFKNLPKCSKSALHDSCCYLTVSPLLLDFICASIS